MGFCVFEEELLRSGSRRRSVGRSGVSRIRVRGTCLARALTARTTAATTAAARCRLTLGCGIERSARLAATLEVVTVLLVPVSFVASAPKRVCAPGAATRAVAVALLALTLVATTGL